MRNPILFLLFIAASSLGCQVQKKVDENPPSHAYEIYHPEWGQFFDSAEVRGCFTYYDPQTQQWHSYQPARVDSVFPPASTYKIPNSLFSLHAGAIPNADLVLPWDSVERQFAGWNRDHNMRTAFKNSAVWFYQEMARRIGTERMQQLVDTIGYGNQNIEGQADLFWLNGELRISPRQQVEFLERLYKETLPFSEEHMKLVKEIMLIEEGDGYKLYGKTGMTYEVGWLVGWLEHDKEVVFFAHNQDLIVEGDSKARHLIPRQIFRSLAWMK
ncbi:MAG: class D beta-lactamase [Bacteroidota bacterium]